MTSNPTTHIPSQADVPTVADGAAALAAAVECFEASERFLAKTVRLLGEVIATGVCEAVEGLPLDIFLTNVCRLIGSDRNTLLTTADVARHMPHLLRLFETGQLSWGQVRNIALKAGRLSREDRGWLDRRVAATVEKWDGLDGFPSDPYSRDALDGASETSCAAAGTRVPALACRKLPKPRTARAKLPPSPGSTVGCGSWAKPVPT